jgi:hypothetical protein
MNADEMNWLLQTIESPETAKRFVRVQYERGRISYHVMVNLVKECGWTDWPVAVAAKARPILMESAAA